MINAVFFDLYETLITECGTNRPVVTAAEKLGIDKNRFQAEWNARREASMAGVIPNYQSLLREICHATQHPPDDNLLEQLQQDRLSLKTAPFMNVENEVIQILDHIRNSGIKIGLISNARREEAAGWKICRLTPLIDDAIFSCEVGLIKPDPRIYHLACTRLSVTPGECLFIGDGGSNELSGAATAGMKPYWATWFLRRWSFWKQGKVNPERSGGFPELAAIKELTAII